MLLIVSMLCGSALLIQKVIAGPSPPSIFDKFAQSDYKLKFEHVDVIYYNKTVAKEFNIVTFKYNRTYTAVNASLELNIDLNNDLEVVIQTYKFASNEYREFSLRCQINACYALSRNLMGLASLTKSGNFSGCSIKKRVRIHISNWHLDESKFPPFIPSLIWNFCIILQKSL